MRRRGHATASHLDDQASTTLATRLGFRVAEHVAELTRDHPRGPQVST